MKRLEYLRELSAWLTNVLPGAQITLEHVVLAQSCSLAIVRNGCAGALTLSDRVLHEVPTPVLVAELERPAHLAELLAGGHLTVLVRHGATLEILTASSGATSMDGAVVDDDATDREPSGA